MNKLKQDELPTAIIRQLSMFQLMGLPALREKFKELYGFETGCTKVDSLRRRLAFRVQELHFGGLTEREEQKMEDSIKNDPVILGSKIAEKKPKPLLHGTRLVRIWKGKKYEVTLCDEGKFEYNGIFFKSLSAVAKAITGTHWNGKTFFGVK
jgi:hypothetical protein